MIVLKSIDDLVKNQEIFKNIKATNYQQTYKNIYSIFKSDESAITFIEDEMLTVLIKKDENIYECPLNIEPILHDKSTSRQLLDFIYSIKKYLNKTIYFPLVYADSKFYKALKYDIYTYKRLYTSICNYTKIGNIINKVSSSDKVYYSNRNVKKFESKLYIKYYTKINPTDIIKEIEKESWKFIVNQDMITKKEQLMYYSSLVQSGVASIAVSYMKDTNDMVAYRIDAKYNNKIHVLKNSYKEQYKKYSPGSYMLISDLYNQYKNFKYVDLYGGPGLAKNMIETYRVNRYDMLIGDIEVIRKLENNRKQWDEKNYNNFLSGKSVKEVFNNKKNILAVTSCFGLGPVGKLSAIVEASKNDFNWFASGEEFDINIFNDKKVFVDKYFTMDKTEIKKFIDKYNIKYALVVLKNKMARLLLELGVKVIYVDSLPFMWSIEDAKTGKIPYNVDCYCAQKTIELSKQSNNLFADVKNLVWVNPIINTNNNNLDNDESEEFILINIGGLHSPTTDGFDYVEVVVKSIVDFYRHIKVIITTSSKASCELVKYFQEYSNVSIKVLTQKDFLGYIKNSKIFFTSPGLTTMLESRCVVDKVIFLPPQNISQFYNVEYGKEIFKYYKEITWNNSSLSLKGLEKYLDKDEHGVIQIINDDIKKMNNHNDVNKFKKHIEKIINSDYIVNDMCGNIECNGALQVINNIKKVMEE